MNVTVGKKKERHTVALAILNENEVEILLHQQCIKKC
jgi:hypothetical protein